jgi:DNA-3-methyladenine glycosylase I
MTPRLRSGRTYHDDSPWPHLELGPRDDRRYFEQLIKAIFQAGLRWPTIESRWPAFGEVFHDFDPVAVAAMTEQDVDRAARDTRIIRHHRKIFRRLPALVRLARGGDRRPAAPLSRPG